MDIVIPIAPVTKKNHQRIVTDRRTGRPFIVQSPQYARYEREAIKYMPRIEAIDERVNVKCLFYMPTRRRCDLTNLLESIDDVLVKSGVLKDDDFTVIWSHDGSRVLYDKDKPRTEISIERVSRYEGQDAR